MDNSKEILEDTELINTQDLDVHDETQLLEPTQDSRISEGSPSHSEGLEDSDIIQSTQDTEFQKPSQDNRLVKRGSGREEFNDTLPLVASQKSEELDETQPILATQNSEVLNDTELLEATENSEATDETQPVVATQNSEILDDTEPLEATQNSEPMQETQLVAATQNLDESELVPGTQSSEQEDTQLVEPTQESTSANSTYPLDEEETQYDQEMTNTQEEDSEFQSQSMTFSEEAPHEESLTATKSNISYLLQTLETPPASDGLSTNKSVISPDKSVDVSKISMTPELSESTIADDKKPDSEEFICNSGSSGASAYKETSKSTGTRSSSSVASSQNSQMASQPTPELSGRHTSPSRAEDREEECLARNSGSPRDLPERHEEKTDAEEANVSLPEYDQFVSLKEQPLASSPIAAASPQPSRKSSLVLRRSSTDEEPVNPSDPKFKLPQQRRSSDKRKQSDLSDSSMDGSVPAKRPCVNGDSRRSVMIVKEINVSSPPIDSQDIQLHYNASQADTAPGLSDSILPFDEDDDDIMEVSSGPKQQVVEILLDASAQTPSPAGLSQSQAAPRASPVENNSSKSSSPDTVPLVDSEPAAVDSSHEFASPVGLPPRRTIEIVKKLLVSTKSVVECRLTADASSGKVMDCSILQFEICESTIKEDRRLRRSSIDSSGALADESSPPSPPKTRDSLSSVVSGPGPFRLQPTALQRMSMFSTTSSSSTGSANNALPSKGLGGKTLSNGLKKSALTWDTPLGEWNVGAIYHDNLKTSLKSHFDAEISSSMNRDATGTARESSPSGAASSPSVEQMPAPSSNKDTDNREDKTEKPLTPVVEETSSEEKLAVKKDAISPSTPSRRASSKRLRQKKNSGSEQEAPNLTPKTDRRKRGGRATASPAVTTPTPTPQRELRGRPQTPMSPSLSRVEAVPSPSTPGSPAFSFGLQPGIKVFAMWTDRRYYPAELSEPSRQGQWRVKFHDGPQKDVSEQHILLVGAFECDQSVSASAGDRVYNTGTIVDVKAFENKEDVYVVKLTDNSTVDVPLSNLSLSESQAQDWIDKHSMATGGTSGRNLNKRPIDLDNVVHGKRLRSSRCASPSVPCSSRELKFPTSESSSCEDPQEPDILVHVSGIEQECSIADPLAGKGSRKAKGKKSKAVEKPRTADEEELLKELGPIPQVGSKIFSGYTFFITSTSRRLEHNHLSQNSSGDDGSTDCECFNFSKKRLIKSRLREQITAGGGQVLTNVNELEPNADLKRVFVVSDRPCRTAVYIRCLALGIKSILHDSIILTCAENEPFGNDRLVSSLPVGHSYVERRYISWSSVTNPKVFLNQSILVQSPNRSFIRFWEKVVGSAGAVIAKLKAPDDLAFVTVIVAEHPVEEKLRFQAVSHDIPIVSAEWITQSLINNFAYPPNAHPRFNIEYSESD